jgi:hypothetical protein
LGAPCDAFREKTRRTPAGFTFAGLLVTEPRHAAFAAGGGGRTLNLMKKGPSKWHAVTVVLHATSCAAATLCRNARFLAQEAPMLPLPECPNRPGCRCVYRHFDDRRNGPRRTEDLKGGLKSDTPPKNRRALRGRRARDQV